MALNIKSSEVERLATEVAGLANESKTEAIRKALLERRERLQLRGMSRRLRVERFLEDHIWPSVPAELLGVPVSRKEAEEILGFGPDGV